MLNNQQTTTTHLDTSIDVALNTWAVSVQLAILLVLTVVFISLWTHFPRRYISFWSLAWLSNLLALLSIFAVLAGTGYLSEFSLKGIYLLYAFCKTWFAILLVIGLSRHLNRIDIISQKMIKLWLVITVLSLLTILITPLNTLHIQIMVYLLVGAVLFGAGGFFIVKKNFHSGWILPAVFCLEGMVFLHHGSVLIPTLWGEAVPRYMTRISFFDSISELIVGITCVLAISNRVIKEVQNRNLDLEQAQQNLRELIDEDPLTKLWNRRKLKSYMSDTSGQTVLIYIDVDNFKLINDQWGHAVGDLCLTRIADSMRNYFDSKAGLFRLGGDEFLAVFNDQNKTTTLPLVKDFSQSLAHATNTCPAISVSVGLHEMTENQSFDEALSAADQAMYLSKQTT
ncbi:MAG: GGDEF domain-containing protein [Marinicella sp.]